MDDGTGQEPARTAAADDPRRAVEPEAPEASVAPARRRRRRWFVGGAALAVAAIAITGSIVSWSSQSSAETLAHRIEAWHAEHGRAGCELDVRIVSAVGLQQRAEDVLRAAEHVPSAETLLGERERTVFGERREALLRTLADGGFVTDDDRAVARTWQARAAAAADPTSFDVLAACLEDTAARRTPLKQVAPDQAPDLERELRALGDPRDFDDARIDRLEAAIGQLLPATVAIAQSRVDLASLEADLTLVPQQALASVRDADAHLRALLELVGGAHSPADVLDLVEGLAMHVAAGWVAEAWQLEAAGDLDAASARAAAAASARVAIAQAAPRPITDRGPAGPLLARPPLSEPPPLTTPEPTPSVGPEGGAWGPVDPGPSEPAPSDPVPSEPAPVEPGPIEPGPTEPAPTDPAPELGDPPAPDPSLAPGDPTPAPSPEPSPGS